MSNVHVFFDTDKEKKKYICRLCHAQLELLASGSTGSRLAHLTGLHKIQDVNEAASAVQNTSRSPAPAPSGSGRQPTLERFDVSISDAQKKRIRRAMLNWLVSAELPFQVAAGARFSEFLQILHPAVRPCIPSPETLFRTDLPLLYADVKAAIIAELQKPRGPVSWALDGWTDSCTSNHYLLLSVGYVAGDQLRRVCLAVEHTPDGQEAGMMAELVRAKLVEFGITDAWIGVSDTASNMRALCLNEMRHCWLPCIAHTLNLVISDAVAGLGAVNDTLEHLNTVIRFFHQSSIASAQLTKEIEENSAAVLTRECAIDPNHPKQRKVPPKKLKARAPTRWNSLIDMLRRFYCLNAVVCKCLLNNKVRSSRGT